MTMKSQLTSLFLMSDMLGDTMIAAPSTKIKRQRDPVTISGHERKRRKIKEKMKKQSRRKNRGNF